jgi:small subunit ribosomal protein S1
VRHPSDVVKPGDRVEAVILAIKPEERRISLGLKQTLSDPWSVVPKNLAVGSQIEGPVTRLTKFGAFVQLAEGVEGLVHVSEISAERRINHPQDVLRAGQVVKAQVLAIDSAKRQIKLSMKQLVPTSIDEYIGERKPGDTVSGRVIEETMAGGAMVELGEGILATCAVPASAGGQLAPETSPRADLSSLSSMLQARWKGSSPVASSEPEPLRSGQVRSFKIVKLDPQTKRIDVEVA